VKKIFSTNRVKIKIIKLDVKLCCVELLRTGMIWTDDYEEI